MLRDVSEEVDKRKDRQAKGPELARQMSVIEERTHK